MREDMYVRVLKLAVDGDAESQSLVLNEIARRSDTQALRALSDSIVGFADLILSAPEVLQAHLGPVFGGDVDLALTGLNIARTFAAHIEIIRAMSSSGTMSEFLESWRRDEGLGPEHNDTRMELGLPEHGVPPLNEEERLYMEAAPLLYPDFGDWQGYDVEILVAEYRTGVDVDDAHVYNERDWDDVLNYALEDQEWLTINEFVDAWEGAYGGATEGYLNPSSGRYPERWTFRISDWIEDVYEGVAYELHATISRKDGMDFDEWEIELLEELTQ